MRTKRVNRYYCDFCKKSGGSASHMSRHEKRCTMNPNRTCGVCGFLDLPQPSMDELLAALPTVESISEDDGFGGTKFDTGPIDGALAVLREVANNCPACILAALRQRGIPIPAVTAFDFKTEMDAAWAAFNESQRETPSIFW